MNPNATIGLLSTAPETIFCITKAPRVKSAISFIHFAYNSFLLRYNTIKFVRFLTLDLFWKSFLLRFLIFGYGIVKFRKMALAVLLVRHRAIFLTVPPIACLASLDIGDSRLSRDWMKSKAVCFSSSPRSKIKNLATKGLSEEVYYFYSRAGRD